MYLKYITGAKKIKIKKNKKKRIYTSAFESAGIGTFKLYWPDTYSSAFVNAGIGTAYASVFKNAGIDRSFKLYWFKIYTSNFYNAGISSAYASAFKSAGIGLESIEFKRPIPALLKALA